ncbi:MAG TPA: hypothetical protein VGM77_10635 [Gemmatimonadales bacterium]|jgi:hypothetical protein
MNDDYSDGEVELLDGLHRLHPSAPAADIRERFRARTAAYRPRRTPHRSAVLLALAAMLLLTVALLRSHDRDNHEQETIGLQRQLTAALQNLSAATRLQAINTAKSAPAGDSVVTAALVSALLHDQNANVRVAAAEALAQLAPSRAVRLAAAQGLATERSPFVQVALLDVVRQLQPADRVHIVRQLLAQPDLDADVRDAATQLSTL